MNVGTRSVLFGVHQFILHPLFGLAAWLIIYKSWPKLYQLCAIITHDLGYYGMPNMDGTEGSKHPERVANLWANSFGKFGIDVSNEILGHSRFYAKKNGLPLSMLFRADKLATGLYPIWLYLILGNLSGEIHEYMSVYKNRYYFDNTVDTSGLTQIQWLIETQSNMSLMGLEGDRNETVRNFMGGREVEGLDK